MRCLLIVLVAHLFVCLILYFLLCFSGYIMLGTLGKIKKLKRIWTSIIGSREMVASCGYLCSMDKSRMYYMTILNTEIERLRRLNTEIAFLQETRTENHKRLRKPWVGQVYHSSFNHRGTDAEITNHKRTLYCLWNDFRSPRAVHYCIRSYFYYTSSLGQCLHTQLGWH